MIKQSELRAVLAARRRVQDLRAHEVVKELDAAVLAENRALNEIRRRFEDREAVEAGPLEPRRRVSSSVVVSYQKFWELLRRVPAVAKVLEKDGAAKSLADQVDRKQGEFVTIRHGVSFDVVPSAG